MVGPRRHLEQHPSAPGGQRRICCTQALQLIRARFYVVAPEAETLRVRHGGQRLNDAAFWRALAVQFEIGAAFEVGLSGHAQDRAGIAVGVVPEVMILPVAQNNEVDGDDCA